MALDNKDDLPATTEAPVEDVSTEVDAPIEEKKVESRFSRENEGKKSIRNVVKQSIKDVNKNLDGDEPLPMTAKEKKAAGQKLEPDKKASSEDKKSSDTTDKSNVDKPIEVVSAKAPQEPAAAPPAALTKEEKAVWDNVPQEIQKAFLRREADTQKGVEQLKAKYQPIEEILAPLKPLLQQAGLTEAHAIRNLFEWHRSLASPNKATQAEAFRALARSHGFDYGALTPRQPQQDIAPPAIPQGDVTQPNVDPLKQIENLLDQRLQPVNQQLNFYQQELQRQRLESANNELAVFAKDKPHFDKARVRMAEILSTAAQFGRPVTLQDAYDEAVWGISEVRNELLQSQEQERQSAAMAAQQEVLKQSQEAEAERLRKEQEAAVEAKRKEQEALERARKASVSPRSTAPVAPVSLNKGPKKAQSVGDTVRSVMKEFGSVI